MALTVFATYQFSGSSYNTNNDFGYSAALHCNYIQEVIANDLNGKNLSLYFSSLDDFKFLSDSSDNNGTGFSATRLYALVQVKNGVSDSTTTITPDPDGWKRVDITDQISGHTVGNPIQAANLKASIFNINPTGSSLQDYDLTYLNYMAKTDEETENMGFGEESVFFGTVRTDIRATAYSTVIPLNLALEEFNTTTNDTWDGSQTILITEIGIYDDDNDLVGIGKLNYPKSKNGDIARSLIFSIDF